MSRTIATVAIAATLAACAPMRYSQAIDDLRDTSVANVAAYSKQVRDFLYAGHHELEAI